MKIEINHKAQIIIIHEPVTLKEINDLFFGLDDYQVVSKEMLNPLKQFLYETNNRHGKEDYNHSAEG
jgi:hypothetical protein